MRYYDPIAVAAWLFVGISAAVLCGVALLLWILMK